MAIIIETCPTCGHDLMNEVICTFPPIPRKSCPNCGWSWEGEQEEVIRVPFGGSNLIVDDLVDVTDCSYTTLNAIYSFGNKIDGAIENTVSQDELNRINQEFNGMFINDSFEKSPCDNCSNNPKNGGSGMCFCTLGQQNITYV